MRILLMSAVGIAALSAAPATAQSYSPGYSNDDGGDYARVAVPRPWQIRSMVDAAERRGDITEDQATNMREEADELARLDRRAQRDDDGDARRNVTRRTFALLRDLREARGDSGTDFAYRSRSPDYPPAYRTAPQGSDDDDRPAPRSDTDDRYTPPAGDDDSYRSAPRTSDPSDAPPSDDPNRAAPENDDPYRAAPPATDPYRAAPPAGDDQTYDDSRRQDDALPADDGIYRPRND